MCLQSVREEGKQKKGCHLNRFVRRTSYKLILNAENEADRRLASGLLVLFVLSAGLMLLFFLCASSLTVALFLSSDEQFTLLFRSSVLSEFSAPALRITADDLIAAFRRAGLEADEPTAMAPDDYGLAPFVCKGTRFLIPSLGEDSGGRIFICERKEDLDLLARYYNQLGRSTALFFSWVFVRDQVLLQINGSLTEDVARKYEQALSFLPALPASSALTTSPTPSPSTPAGVDILNNHATYMDGSALYVVGEVVNRTGSSIDSLRVTADVFNQGQLVDTEVTRILNSVAAEGKVCFKVNFWTAPANWNSYNLTRSYQAGGAATLGLNVFNNNGAVIQSGGYEIVGQVRNDSTQRTESVEVISTLYDASGTVVDCEESTIYTADLNPGETSSFKVTFSQRTSYDNVTDYHLYVQGRPTAVSLTQER